MVELAVVEREGSAAMEWVQEERWISAFSLCEMVGVKRRLLQGLVREHKLKMHNGKILREEALRLFPGYVAIGLVGISVVWFRSEKR